MEDGVKGSVESWCGELVWRVGVEGGVESGVEGGVKSGVEGGVEVNRN